LGIVDMHRVKWNFAFVNVENSVRMLHECLVPAPTGSTVRAYIHVATIEHDYPDGYRLPSLAARGARFDLDLIR
jgi:hypothetical protein